MASVALIAAAAGGVLTAYSQVKQGNEQMKDSIVAASQMEEQAKIADQNASRQKGSAQRKSAEQLRQNRLLQSRQIALSAAGGQSGSKNVADLLSRTQSEGEYSSSISLYEGDLRADSLYNQAASLRQQASNTRYEGKQARKAANIGAISGLLKTGADASSFQSKYGNGGFQSTQTSTPQRDLNNSSSQALYGY